MEQVSHMLRIKITSQDHARLQELRHHQHPLVQQKATILLLKYRSVDHNKICATFDICGNTLCNYLKGYQQYGLKFVEAINAHKPQSKLISFDDKIKQYLDQTPPATIDQAREEIYQLTGVKLGKTQMRHHLKRLGAKHRKIGTIPAKADPEKQKEFKEKEMDPRLLEAKKGLRTVFYVDAAHFVLGAFLCCVWSLVRCFIRGPSGRSRFNVLGALNAITKELTTITNTTYITSIQVCELLQLLAAKTQGPITVILDNAKYQRCAKVIEFAKNLGIELLFLPTYSPNLNLIERVWKFTKKHCLNGKYYKNFDLFKNAISSFLDTAHIKHKAAFKSLLSLNFQLFSSAQIKQAL